MNLVISGVLIMGLAASTAASGRNPFLPLTEPCYPPLEGYRLAGVVSGANFHMALVKKADGGWLRLVSGQWMVPGWQLVAMNSRGALLKTAGDCPLYHWGIFPQRSNNGTDSYIPGWATDSPALPGLGQPHTGEGREPGAG